MFIILFTKSFESRVINENRFLNFGKATWMIPLFSQTDVSRSESQLVKTSTTFRIRSDSFWPSMQTIPVKMGGKLTPPMARFAAKTSDFLFSRICWSLKIENAIKMKPRVFIYKWQIRHSHWYDASLQQKLLRINLPQNLGDNNYKSKKSLDIKPCKTDGISWNCHAVLTIFNLKSSRFRNFHH